MKATKYTIKDFHADYPDDDACLEYLFQKDSLEMTECPKCDREFKYYRRANRKFYECQWCSNQISPTADTIFHKSSTPLKDWFYAIYLFSVSKNGVSGKELERQLGVTYKTAWRMAKQIRTLFGENGECELLEGTVEIDETYVGGVRKGRPGRGADGKTPVIGAVERNGEVRAKVVADAKSSTIKPFIRNHVRIDAEIMTDEYISYRYLSRAGYTHDTVRHSAKEYARGNTHTNTIEGFWSQLKRSVHGTYHAVSPKYLQNYVDEFAFRYNNRKNATPLFCSLIGRVI